MNGQITVNVRMELLSDTIFGSGYSIPGGEDIAVCQDELGFPYLKGSTFKGLLRESLQNWLCWTGGDDSELSALLGESGWEGPDHGRKIHLSELRLADAPKEPEDCFSTRAFTSLENGVVKAGSLRTASCIRSGLCFSGDLTCIGDDAELLCQALTSIKWVGSMRSRGFGRVRLTCKTLSNAPVSASRFPGTHCIRYRLQTVSPVLITDLSRSCGNGMETRDYIPGASIRGMVINILSGQYPEWFAAHRQELLGDDTCFLDAVPVCGKLPVLPAIMGFYEDKEETRFESIVLDGTFSPGLKRAKLGSFCAPNGEILQCWSASTSGSTRIGIHADDVYQTDLFQTRYLDGGQSLEGYILLRQPELAEKIGEVFCGDVWIGADRYSGFGKCELTLLEAAEEPAWRAVYGCSSRDDYDTDLYLLAVSPLTMLDASGSPCGLDLDFLARALGVGEVEVKVCSTAVREYGGYNRTWQSRVPAAQMYERGSLFHLICDRSPDPERLMALQRSGIGIRRTEGFGQILFLKPALIEGLKQKRFMKPERNETVSSNADIRRKRYRWVMDNVGIIRRSGLSASQIGTLQAICEKSRTKDDLTELDAWLDNNLYNRGDRHGERFQTIAAFVRRALSGEFDEEGVSHSHSGSERLETLIILLDLSRKAEIKGGDSR